jgi:outer membrane biosynthesis protein TonB
MIHMKAHMAGVSRRIVAATSILSLVLWGCYRSSPPELPEFRPPPKKIVKETAPPEAVEDAPEPEYEEPPEPEPEPEPLAATPAPQPAAAAPQPKTQEEAPAAPTIIGTWRMTDMLINGQSMMPPGEGLEMTFTFAEGGVLTASRSGPLPEPHTAQGSYTIDGNQITMTMEGDTQTGTFTLDAHVLTLNFDQMQMVLTR